MAQVLIKTTDSVQARINGSADGDTIAFEGDFLLGPLSNLPGKRTYKTLAGSRIRGTPGDWATFQFANVSDLTLDLVLNNATVNLKSCSRVNGRFDVRENRNWKGPESVHAIFTRNLIDSSLTGTFTNMVGAGVDTCIWAYDPIRCKFNGGRGDHVHEFIHIMWYNYYDPDSANPIIHDCEVNENIVRGIERHALELQGGPAKLRVLRNHITGRFKDGINLSIATGGKFDNNGGKDTYRFTKDILVDSNVCDNSGFTPSHYSQCMGVEAMGDITVTNNWFVRCGQGIALTYNPPGTVIKGNKFKDQGGNEIVSDEPHPSCIMPPNMSTLNDFKYMGAIPTAAELIGGTTPPDPIPGPTMNLTATAFKTYVDLTLDFTGSTGTTALERRASDNVWLVLTTWPAGQTDTAKPYKDMQFSADQIANKWRFWYRLRDKNGSTPDVVAQIGVNSDPTTPPPGAPTTTEHTLEFPPILVEGQPVKLERTVKVTATGDRKVEAK